MQRFIRWQWAWLVGALIWGAILWAQTDWPSVSAVDPQTGRPISLSAVVINQAGYWLLTSAAAYFVCHGIAWSRRGISRDISHLR